MENGNFDDYKCYFARDTRTHARLNLNMMCNCTPRQLSKPAVL